jgi:PucR family transcriptional regulator, purine catabolism regulatory protein
VTTTVGDLLAIEELSLRLVAGAAGVDRPIRWAHVSELDDPTRWLRGGEILLTTGLGLGQAPSAQARYVDQLARAKLAGLGLGLGFAFDQTPAAVAGAADAAGFPVFEVPFEIPFIAITEALFSRLVNEQFVLLQRAGTVQQSLSRLLVDAAGLDALLGAYARMTGTAALLFDLHGEVVASSPEAARLLDARVAWEEVQALRPEEGDFAASLSGRNGSRSLLPILVGGAPKAFLVIARSGRAEPFHQVVSHHLATAIALELAKSEAVARTERRLVGDFLDALLEGELSGDETARRLRFLGLGAASSIAALVGRPEHGGSGGLKERSGSPPENRPSSRSELDGQTPAEDRVESLHRLVEDRLSRRPAPYVCSIHDGAVVALFEAADPAEARAAVEAVAETASARGLAARFGLGMPDGEPRAPRRAYQEARFALDAAHAQGKGRVACIDDLGSHRLLLALQQEAALDAFSRGLLAPLRAYDRRQHGDLVASLRTFLEHNGNWESAARALGVHRHTLRYRIRRVVELTGRDLDAAADRVEFWMALQAEQILAARRRT